MARRKGKRSWGSGSVQKRSGGLVIRWREKEMQTDGTTKTVHRCEALGDLTISEGNDKLREKLSLAKTPKAAPVTFDDFAASWKALVLPKYPKHSTRKGHGDIVDNKLIPFFKGTVLSELTGEHVQQFISEMEMKDYAAHSIHHYHTVLSTILSTAVRWKRIPANPAFGAKLPPLKAKRKQDVLTYDQARELMAQLPIRCGLAVSLALMTGARRGELFALRWRHFDPEAARIEIVEAVYDDVIDTPKTANSIRQVPIAPQLVQMLEAWRKKTQWSAPSDFILAGRLGVRGDQARMLRDHIKPAGEYVGAPNVTWLTFRRTWNTWADEKGVSPKIRGAVVGNSAEINQKMYTKVIPDSVRNAVQLVADNLCAECAHEPDWVN